MNEDTKSMAKCLFILALALIVKLSLASSDAKTHKATEHRYTRPIIQAKY